MGRYIGIPLLLLAAILNTTVMAKLRIGGGAPDLVFLLVISWALLTDLRDGLLWAVIGGVLVDWFSVAPLGTSALGMVVVVLAANTVFGSISRNNIFVPPLVALAGTPIYHAAILFVLRTQGYAVPLSAGLWYVTVPAMIYNGVVIIPVFRFVGLIYRVLLPRRVRLD